MPNPPQPTVSLKDRIAALQQKTTSTPGSSHSSTPTNGSQPSALTASGGQAALLKSKIAAFEEKGGTPVPRGSFGMGAVPTKQEREAGRKRGELYGNRIQHHGVPVKSHRTGGLGAITPNITGISPNVTGQLTGDPSYYHPRSVSDSFQREPGATIQATSFSEDSDLGVEQDMLPISRYERRYSTIMSSPSPPDSRSPSPPPVTKQPQMNRSTPFATALEKAKLAEASGTPVSVMTISPQPTGSLVQNSISPQVTGVSAQATGGNWSYATFNGVHPTVKEDVVEEPESIIAQSFEEDSAPKELVELEETHTPQPLDLDSHSVDSPSPLASPQSDPTSPYTPHTPIIVVSEDPIPVSEEPNILNEPEQDLDPVVELVKSVDRQEVSPVLEASLKVSPPIEEVVPEPDSPLDSAPPMEELSPTATPSPVAELESVLTEPQTTPTLEEEPHTPMATSFQPQTPSSPSLLPRSDTLDSVASERHSIASVQSLYVSTSPSRRTSFNSPSHIAFAHKIPSPSGAIGAEEARAIFVSPSPQDPGDNYDVAEDDLVLEVVPSDDPRQTFYVSDDLLDYSQISVPVTPATPVHEMTEDEDVFGQPAINTELAKPSYKVVVNRSKTTAGTTSTRLNKPPPKLKGVKIRGMRGETVMPMSPSGYADLASLVQASVLLEQQLEGGVLPSESKPRPPSMPPKSKSEVALNTLVEKERALMKDPDISTKKRKKSLRDVFGRKGRSSAENFSERSDPGPSAFRAPTATTGHYPERKSSLTHLADVPPLPNERPRTSESTRHRTSSSTRPGTSGSVRPGTSGSMMSVPASVQDKDLDIRREVLETAPLDDVSLDDVPPTPPPKNNRVVNGLRRLATTATGKATERPISSVGELPTLFPRRQVDPVSTSSGTDSSFTPSNASGQSHSRRSGGADRPAEPLRHSLSVSSMSMLSSEDSSSVVTPPEASLHQDFGLVQTPSGGIGPKKVSGSGTFGRFIKGMRRPRTKSSASSLSGSADSALLATGSNPRGNGKHKEKDELSTPPRTPPTPPQIPELTIISPKVVPRSPNELSSLPLDFEASPSSFSRRPVSDAPPSPLNDTRPVSFISTTTAASSNRDSIVDAFPSVPPLPPPSHSRGNSNSTLNSGRRGQEDVAPSSRRLPEPQSSPRRLPEVPGSARQSFEPSWPMFDKLDGQPKAGRLGTK